MKWEILSKDVSDPKKIIQQLLLNRGIKTKKEIEEFLKPKDPKDIKWLDLGIDKKNVDSIIKRLKEAKDKNQKIVIFGDYDADGVCATAILWETLYKLGFNVLPYIPDRFEEGYGIKSQSFENEKFKSLNAELIITVDNGIVANDAVKEANKRKIDCIIVDHHQLGLNMPNTPYVLHSTVVCGSALSWFISREIIGRSHRPPSLDLVAIGTVADQMPLLGLNRSLVKYGLKDLEDTKRIGLRMLFELIGIREIGTFEIGFLIAPRINAMGRLTNAIDSLRLLCTKDKEKSKQLSKLLNQTNIERQKIVDDVVSRAMIEAKGEEKIIVISGQYHEGVIGLASGKITEKFYRPSIVLSLSEKISKASARSIPGFNIIEAIKETGMIMEGGGHPMAAGFSIKTSKIEQFKLKINELSQNKLNSSLLEKKLKVDLEISFEHISQNLVDELKTFEPFGNENYPPLFVSKNVKIVDSKIVGSDGKHLKLKLMQNNIVFDAIAFGFANDNNVKTKESLEIVFGIEQNVWNNKKTIQLKIKDIS